ncbi:hypothetical protein [Dankookia rubra]|uniref:hypothetical protein n=1 Tax=Dankookia rubra TaxID=1442381 RepID=UPI00140A937D|nr:hypothetical protein [Dankookia rubra]
MNEAFAMRVTRWLRRFARRPVRGQGGFRNHESCTASRSALAWLCLLPGLAAAQPAPNRVYGLQGGAAHIAISARGGWEVRDAAGHAVAAATGPDAALRVPPGGWYRLYRDGTPFGGRFAAGHVVLVSGQSQASGLFDATWPRVGAHPAGPGDAPAPPVSAILQSCLGRAGCPAEGTRWVAPGEQLPEPLGARALLAELALLRPGIPFALADATWGGAGIADLLDPARPARGQMVRVAEAAAPASALLLLAHGTTDAMRGTPAGDYVAGVGALVALLRAAGGDPAMPALQAPLSPLRDAAGLLGSGRLADRVGLAAGEGWPFRLGLAQRRPLDPATAAHAGVIRAAQAEAARRFGLLPGGDLTGVATGADGIHWTAEGARQAAREAAAAIVQALDPGDAPGLALPQTGRTRP